jgi:hypothetical protein
MSRSTYTVCVPPAYSLLLAHHMAAVAASMGVNVMNTRSSHMRYRGGGGAHLFLVGPEQAYEQGLREAVRDERSHYLRCHEPPDGEAFGPLMRLFGQFPGGTQKFISWVLSLIGSGEAAS